MTPLQWQESPEQVQPQMPSTAPSAHPSSTTGKADPWFAIAIALIGLIVGFWLGKSRGIIRPVALGSPPPQIAAPIPRAPAIAKEKTIKMTAELWKFTPNIVRVKQGETITLEVTGVSGTHGFSVPGLGISETIIQGNTVSVTIPTDKTGTFAFSCSIQCGSGHNDMTGQIIVEG
ncbi:MAG TPA: cupredoxin domain-containing protein [Candidatus Peribacteraceae bacterium]|nr:cupredoxin domain-containing protein [Candidatus Peribacteraceae bacterium]